ncbi:MAG: hypothetical protein AB8G23_14050 [Myxococcota bacterium]
MKLFTQGGLPPNLFLADNVFTMSLEYSVNPVLSGGYLDLDDGEALLIRMPSTNAQYQAIQLADIWMASLEYGNQVSSLTIVQSVLSDDGADWYLVLAPRRQPGPRPRKLVGRRPNAPWDDHDPLGRRPGVAR